MATALVPQFLRFGIVGVAGYVVDVTVLYFALTMLGTGPYAGRALSYLAAATSTWYLNRTITFADRRSSSIAQEWLRWVVLNLAGGALNYATYTAYVHHAGSTGLNPAIGVALGSLAGMVVNFTLARTLIFRAAPQGR